MRIDDDKKFMARALELAANGMGHTRPNPMVGAVLVKDGEIIGEGWHEFYGLARCRKSTRRLAPLRLHGLCDA